MQPGQDPQVWRDAMIILSVLIVTCGIISIARWWEHVVYGLTVPFIAVVFVCAICWNYVVKVIRRLLRWRRPPPGILYVRPCRTGIVPDRNGSLQVISCSEHERLMQLAARLTALEGRLSSALVSLNTRAAESARELRNFETLMRMNPGDTLARPNQPAQERPMVVSPDAAQQLTSAELILVRRRESIIDHALRVRYSGVPVRVLMPNDIIRRRRVKERLLSMYRTGGWQILETQTQHGKAVWLFSEPAGPAANADTEATNRTRVIDLSSHNDTNTGEQT